MKKSLVKPSKRFLRFLVVASVIGIAGVAGINMTVKAVAKRHIVSVDDLKEEHDGQAEAIVVLGAYVRPDGQMSLMLKERVDMGIELYQQGCADKIIMSGDHGTKQYDEVNTMKDYAVSKGVPSEDVFMDHAGFSTYESMYRTRDIFAAKNVIVVTQEYHLYRAVFTGQALGLDVRGVACDKAVYQGDSGRKTREVLARVKDLGYTIIKPEPTYLGEVISISGNGDLTND